MIILKRTYEPLPQFRENGYTQSAGGITLAKTYEYTGQECNEIITCFNADIIIIVLIG